MFTCSGILTDMMMFELPVFVSSLQASTTISLSRCLFGCCYYSYVLVADLNSMMLIRTLMMDD
jgi:hypothetical protein